MSKRAGLPDFVSFKHDRHLVEEISVRTRTPVIRQIPIEKIIPNAMQPRKTIGDLEELAESIKEKGIIEPLLVRPKNGQFEIIAGERRYRAAVEAKMSEIPCIEYDIPDNEALELSIIENLQRKDLEIFETAFSFKTLADIYGYTHQDIAQKIGKSRVTISELIRLTDLPTEIVNKCSELNITSKTFLLELTKLEDIEKMSEVLKKYQEKPFSRDEIKAKRQDEDVKEKNKPLRGIKFNFHSDDKAIKINFNIKAMEGNKDKVILVLEKLIEDIRENRISELK